MNLLELEPTKISRSLEGTSFLVYGPAKIGKTTLASQFPNPIFLSTERGLTALPGVFSQNINSWAEFKSAVTELKKDKVRERYFTVVIDTLTNLIEYLDLYVGAQMSTDETVYKYASDIPYNKGIVRLSKELNEQLQKLTQKNYIIVLISHSEDKTNFKTGQSQIATTLDKKSSLVVERFVDNILYLDAKENKDGEVDRIIYFRGNSQFKAGSRYKYIVPSCKADFETIKSEIGKAIDKEEVAAPGTVIEKAAKAEIFQEPNYDFEGLMRDFKKVTSELMEKSQDNASIIRDIIEKELGVGQKVGNLKKHQSELLFVIVNNLKQFIEEKGE